MIRYQVIYHFDVWGNPRDGFEVHDSRNAGYIDVAEGATDMDVLRALKALGELKSTVRRASVLMSDNGDTIDIDDKQGRPCWTLYLEGSNEP